MVLSVVDDALKATIIELRNEEQTSSPHLSRKHFASSNKINCNLAIGIDQGSTTIVHTLSELSDHAIHE